MFAKLYGEQDQVLVTLSSNDEGPIINISTQPEGLGVCSFSLQYLDTEKGWDDAQKVLDDMTEEEARHYAQGLKDQIEQWEQEYEEVKDTEPEYAVEDDGIKIYNLH